MTARILVVDDNDANRKLLEARLSAEYFDVLTATSGAEAIAICEKALCDIVLLDIMMPEMDGFEVCRRLKSHVSTAHLPIVMVTALDSPADRVHGLEAGADDFVIKPIDDTPPDVDVEVEVIRKTNQGFLITPSARIPFATTGSRIESPMKTIRRTLLR